LRKVTVEDEAKFESGLWDEDVRQLLHAKYNMQIINILPIKKSTPSARLTASEIWAFFKLRIMAIHEASYAFIG
jgi:hypothetical protein